MSEVALIDGDLEFSPTVGELFGAIAKAKAEIPVVPKTRLGLIPTKSGGSYSYTYADGADIDQAVTPSLSKNGLAVVQLTKAQTLVTILGHSSGEWVRGEMDIRPLVTQTTPQGFGSGLSYARRYALSAILGIWTDVDDDGAAANVQTQTAPKKPSGPPMLTKAQGQKLHAMFNERDISDRAERLTLCSTVIGREITSSNDLTKTEAGTVIEYLESVPVAKEADNA